MCYVCLQDLQEDSCPRCKYNSSCEADLETPEAPATDLDKTRAPFADLKYFKIPFEDLEEHEAPAAAIQAIKTCLVCLASYCETHLRLHNELNVGKAHLLVDVTGQLQNKTCPQHHKLLEVYCRTDRQCICCLCMLDTNHKGHEMVSAATERVENQRQLEKTKVMDLVAELKEIQKTSGKQRSSNPFQQSLVQTLPKVPKTREDFIQFLVPLSLDPNTAHRNLLLTEQNQAVSCRMEPQSYPEHPEHFEWWAQVLSEEGLSGRCYWEVVWSGPDEEKQISQIYKTGCNHK